VPLPRPSLADSQLTALDSQPQAGAITGMHTRGTSQTAETRRNSHCHLSEGVT